MIDMQTFVNLGLVVVFVLVGGVFAATEIALVSLRESQVNQVEQRGGRGERVASIARDPNRFLSAVQIGVTVAGFFSAAYGGSTLAPDIAPYLIDVGLDEDAADTVALVLMTLLIAYLSLVLGELVPKRLALQRSMPVALATAPVLDRFATLMRPVIWLLSVSTDALVRLLGGDPHATNDAVSEDELRDIVSTHEGLGDDERRILSDVFAATRSTLKEVMRPRGDVAFIDGSTPLIDAIAWVDGQQYSRYPVIDESFDDVTGFLHVRDLLDVGPGDERTVADVRREVLHLPGTNRVLPTVSIMRTGRHPPRRRRRRVRRHRRHRHPRGPGGGGGRRDPRRVRRARAAFDESGAATEVDGGLTIEDFAEATGIALPDGDLRDGGGYVIARLGRLPEVGDGVDVGPAHLRVEEMEGRRVTGLAISAAPAEGDPSD